MGEGSKLTLKERTIGRKSIFCSFFVFPVTPAEWPSIVQGFGLGALSMYHVADVSRCGAYRIFSHADAFVSSDYYCTKKNCHRREATI